MKSFFFFLNCPRQAFHNSCFFKGDKTYEYELISKVSLVLPLTQPLPEQCFAQSRCLINVELKRKMNSL